MYILFLFINKMMDRAYKTENMNANRKYVNGYNAKIFIICIVTFWQLATMNQIFNENFK